MRGAAYRDRAGVARLILGLCAASALVIPARALAQTTTTYTYDALGRLTSATTNTGNQNNYAYDPSGNRTSANSSVSQATAGNVSLSVAYNTPGSVALTPGGNYSSVAVAAAPSHGSASIGGTTATYTPSSGYYGADSFTYTASGPGGTSPPATVSVTVRNPSAPTVGNVGLSVAYNTAGSVALSPSGVYTSLAVASGPSHGSVSISGTTATYTPSSGSYGSDSFTYTATGPGGTSAPATVSVTVGNPPAPTVGGASLTVNYNTAGSVGLSPSGVYTSLAVASGPAHGSASIGGTTATYTPTSGYSGADSFTYTATGPGGTSSPATVSVTVNNATPLTASVSATSWSWYEYLSQTPTQSGAIAATASGGAGGYTYAWQYVSGDTSQSATSAGSATTSWTRSPTPAANDVVYTSTWRCKVTDSAGTVSYSSNVTVTFEHDNNN